MANLAAAASFTYHVTAAAAAAADESESLKEAHSRKGKTSKETTIWLKNTTSDTHTHTLCEDKTSRTKQLNWTELALYKTAASNRLERNREKKKRLANVLNVHLIPVSVVAVSYKKRGLKLFKSVHAVLLLHDNAVQHSRRRQIDAI